jgi:CBS domain containing-hemolysin-like protein
MLDALIPVIVILLMVAANALYVAAEFATVGSRRSRVQEAAESGNRNAAALLDILRDPKRLDNYVAGCQVGITLSSLVAGAYGQAKLTPLLSPVLGAIGGQVAAIAIVLVLITMLQVVLGELLPKTVALRYPERLAIATLAPMRMSLWIFRPLIAVFNGTAFTLMRWFELHIDHSHAHVHSPEELEALYRESAEGGLIDASERDMLAGALNVDERIVREIMTPRTRLVSVAANLDVATAVARLAVTPYSRYPVTGESVDDVVGVVHLRALFAASRENPAMPVADVMRPPVVVSELMAIPKLWQTLRNAGRHSAIAINEYGSVAGMITLEDALEEIFGEMQDEFDQEEDTIAVRDGRVVVRGDVLIETLNERFDLDLPTEDVDTVSGLIWYELGHVPTIGEEIEIADGLRLRVEAMEKRAVKRASFTQPEAGL